jgi:predicted nucleic acid-binding Zn ribbon protein
MKERKCPSCNYPIQGRADKRFCSVECRNEHNNHKNRDRNNFMRNVNFILRKNRQILEELNPRGKTKIHKGQLLDQGFRFGYMTNIYTTKAGKIYHFCYEHGVLCLDNGFYAIVKRQEYVD